MNSPSQSQPSPGLRGPDPEVQPAAAFTPGPWEFRELHGDDGLGYVEFEGNSQDVIAHTGEECWSPSQNRANGHLISAAPDLVRELMRAVDMADPTGIDCDYHAARAAIAKALGASVADPGRTT